MMMWYSFEIIIYSLPKEGEKANDLPGEAWQSESETERVYSQDCSFENRTYHVGDFVYVKPSEPNLKPHIVCIERLWENETGNMQKVFANFVSKNSLGFITIDFNCILVYIQYYIHMVINRRCCTCYDTPQSNSTGRIIIRKILKFSCR